LGGSPRDLDLRGVGGCHDELMKLPAGDRALIDPSKVRDYLLSPSHPVGRFKAALFDAIEFKQVEWRALVAELARLATDAEAVQTEATAYGQKYEVRGMISSPSGRRAMILSAWIVRSGETIPRFVTAHPTNKS
jgi:hypothetical protein